ncbi:MAG: hypothetical protein J5962_00705 [Lachnospiraceae bacterium]|nr:hypothetical protein [Lachnospiraceae bacterium]
MVTQGTNEGGSNRKRNFEESKEGYSNRNRNYRDKSDYNKSGKASQGERKNYQKRDGGNNFNREDGRRDGRSDNRYGKVERYDKGRSYTPKFAGKDDDEEDYGRRSKPSRPKESKPSVSIPDKDKAMLRIEKEQKSIKKKQQNKKKESNRPQQRVKRANNINYTRSYANGDFDDYDFDDF